MALSIKRLHGILTNNICLERIFMPTLTIVTPTRREIHATYVMSLLQAFGGMNSSKNKTGYTLSFRTLAGKSNIHHARSIAASNWYDSADDRDLMLFIDSDHTYDVDDIISAINKYKKTNADIVCGVYSNSAGTRPNIYPKNPVEFMEGKDDEVWYGGTGFMLISKPILTKMREVIREEMNVERVWISDADGERNVIPFFNGAFIKNELDSSSDIITWLGEDYSFCYRVRKAGGVLRAFVSRTIGHDTSKIKYFFPDNYVNKTWDEDTLVYYCGPSRVTFSPKSNTLGGSEQAVVELARRFKKSSRWKQVYVFGNVTPGIYDGVHYEALENFDINNKFGDIILWRGFGNSILKEVKANRIYIDLHDNTDNRVLPGDVVNSKVEKVFVKSNFHSTLFPQINEDKFVVVPNGIYEDVFGGKKKSLREPYRFMWTSSYERGLSENLAYIWPTIKENFPEAEYHIYYGDEFLNDALKEQLEALYKLPGVFHHGRASLHKIAQERKKSSFHLYVSDTPAEIDCISVRESLAAGSIPIISKASVFAERDGYHVDVTNMRDEVQMKLAATQIVDFIKDKKAVHELRESLYKSDLIFGWDVTAEKWIEEMQVSS